MTSTIPQRSALNRLPSIHIPDPVPAEFSAWLARLPLANPRFCLEAMEAALDSFNVRPNLSPSLRIELAELARPMVHQLAERAALHFLDAHLPYSADADFHIAYGIGMHHELAMAYALAAFDPVCSVPKAKESHLLPMALYRALQYQGRVLLWTAHRYQIPSRGYWLQLYRLYRLAEIYKLLSTHYDDDDEPEPCRTPLGLFLRTVLFALANTRRLRQRDMPTVFALLGLAAMDAWIDKEPFHEQGLAEFFLDMSGDTPPLPSRVIKGRDPAALRFLFTRPLAQALAQLALRPEGANLKLTLDRAVLLRVARSLGGVDKRKLPRRDETAACHCVTGLGALLGALPVPAVISAKPSDTERDMRRSGAMNNYGGEEIWNSGANDEAEPNFIEGRIINSSARGCCVIWPSLPMARARIGEVIGIWPGTSTVNLGFVGAIRWLECYRDGLRFGVERLASRVVAVQLYDATSQPKGKAVLLPAEPDLRPEPELLTLRTVLEEGEMIQIDAGRGLMRYWVQELSETTPSFARYALQAMGAGLD